MNWVWICSSNVFRKEESQIEDFLARDIRGGDLSPYRKFTSHLKKMKQSEMEAPQRTTSENQKLNFFSSMKRHKKSLATSKAKDRVFPEHTEGNREDDEDPAHPRNLGGFSSYIPEDQNKLRIPLNKIQDSGKKNADKKVRQA